MTFKWNRIFVIESNNDNKPDYEVVSEICNKPDYEMISQANTGINESFEHNSATKLKEISTCVENNAEVNHYSEVQSEKSDSGDYTCINESLDSSNSDSCHVTSANLKSDVEPIYAEIRPRLPSNNNESESKNKTVAATKSKAILPCTPIYENTPVSTEPISPPLQLPHKEKHGFRIKGHKKIVPKSVIKMRKAKNTLARVGLYSVPGPPEPIYETVEEALSADSTAALAAVSGGRCFTDPNSDFTIPSTPAGKYIYYNLYTIVEYVVSYE